ncbi:hypothetical protein [Actinoplanes sp. NPDC051411]|uniref:hypothetical protein n=1 Tax=Actinoplanes sp. NPDC051411 TaxID=3155522 RepID=UPI00342D1CAD
MDAIIERVLPGSRVHIQWHGDDDAWRCLTAADVELDRRGAATPVGWRHWAGTPTAVIKVGVAHERQRWWVLAGELPAADSTIVVEIEDGARPPVERVADRVWCCEWAGPPSVASVTVDDQISVTADFRRRAHYLPGPAPDMTEGRGHISRER